MKSEINRIVVRVPICGVLFFVACLTSTARGSTISLYTTTDLSTLTVGQSFNVDVELSGIGSDEYDSLAASALFSNSDLGAPTALTPGAIVPNPLADPLDFQTTALPGQGDAVFATFSGDPSFLITKNGEFFSLTLKALGPGSGNISLDPLSVTAEKYDSSSGTYTTIIPTVGSPLAFDITGGTAVVAPLPSTASAGVIALVTLGLLQSLKRLGSGARA